MPSGLEHSKKSFELRYNHDPLPHKKKYYKFQVQFNENSLSDKPLYLI